MRAGCGALFALSLLACGGRASENPIESATAGRGDEAEAGASVKPDGAGGALSFGGATDVPAPSPEGGAAAGDVGAALAGARDGPWLIEPGTRPCQDERDCLGLDCIRKAGQKDAMCSVACSDAEPCAARERCVLGDGLEPACFVRCDVGTECNYPFDCFDPERDGQFVCVLAPWTVRW